MAGHSKWANIKHKKAAQDAKRGKLFTKLIREVSVAARIGGDDEGSNPRLRTAIDKALAANVTRDTINRAVKRAVGGEDGQDLEEILYEGYANHGVGVMVECVTNDSNRTVSDVRHGFTKFGGNLGTDGSVAYLFTKLGQIIIEPGSDEEKLMDLALENGAEDVIAGDDGSFEVRVVPDSFETLRDLLKKENFVIANAEVTMLAATEIALDLDASQSVMKMIDHLEDLDDVQEVYTNAGFSDDAF